jgi:RNA polymerase sigma-70 factor, ECF subfamily
VVQQLETLADPVLWTRALRGDKGSFEELVRRYARSVYGIAMAILSDPDAAEDVSQEAFTRAWARLGTCESPSRVGPWLLGIARNGTREALRSRKRAAVACVQYADAERRAPAEDREEQIGQVLRALATLGEEGQALLALKYQEGLSCKEIAARTGMTVSNVKVSIFRAYEKLRSQVKA